MNRDRYLIVFILVATVVLTVQCGKASPTSIPSPGESQLSPLLVDVSPVDGPDTVLQGSSFSIDEPLRAGAKMVEGTGPDQVGILVVDVTLMGQVLGRAQIGEDGRFSIPVQPPLIVNHRIGLMLDDQSPGIVQTQSALNQLEQFSGDSAIMVPRVGKIYDAASVKP